VTHHPKHENDCACPESAYEIKGPAADFKDGSKQSNMCVRQEEGVGIRTVACISRTDRASSPIANTRAIPADSPLNFAEHRAYGLLKSYDPNNSNLTQRDLFCHQYGSWNQNTADSNRELWTEMCEDRKRVYLDHPSYYFNKCERTYAPINKSQATEIAFLELNLEKEERNIGRRAD
jgi:hypothetical protein